MTTKRAVIYLRVSTRRQVDTWITDDGLSISAQNDLCIGKADQLGAEVLETFRERGESATSREGRVELARMLEYVADNPVDYVIFTKIDRFVRNERDFIDLKAEIEASGAQLVSATEYFDESTPEGWLMQHTMVGQAVFESKRNGYRVKIGMGQKAKLGGTPNVPAMGYLNYRQPATGGGRGVALIVIDEERAPHIRWAFQAYASGDWSTRQITEELEERGLRSRPRKHTAVPKPLTHGQVHRMLRNRYYIGIVTYKGEEHDGIHEPIIDEELFYRVQDLLSARRKSHTKYRKHDHYLKGSIYCRRCRQRFYYRQTTNRHGNTYEYFLCRGRNNNEGCQTPHLPVDQVETAVEKLYQAEFLTDDSKTRLHELLVHEAESHDHTRAEVVTAQEARLERLLSEEHKNKLAYHADAMSLEVLKAEKERISKERADARAVISRASARYDEIADIITQAIQLTDNWHKTYRTAPPTVRRMMNQVFFDRIWVDEQPTPLAQYSRPYQHLIDVDTELQRITKSAEPLFARETPHGLQERPRQTENPDTAQAGRGSQQMLMVGHEGIEPPTPCASCRCSSQLS